MVDINGFLQLSKAQLGDYLEGIAEFVGNRACNHEGRPDSLTSQPPDSYLRNMLAVGIISHLHRSEFLAAKQRIIVLPDCLKNYGEEVCCKADLGNATACTQCNANCLVFEAVERFVNGNTVIVLEPENLKEFLQEARREHDTVGIVGVACALTLLSGYVHTLELKLPTQGVLLNYSSCAHHWADPGYNTNFSFKRLAWVLGRDEKPEPRPTHRTGETYSLERIPHTPPDYYATIDTLARRFERDYFPQFKAAMPGADLFELSQAVMKALVPDVITRDSV